MVWFLLSWPMLLDDVDFFSRIFSIDAVTFPLVFLILIVFVTVSVFWLLPFAAIHTV